MRELKNPLSIVNFIAAYGTHASITSVTTLADKRAAAEALVFDTTGDSADRLAFLNATGAYAGGTLGGLNLVDLWIGGLAEAKPEFGGMLGTTFNYVFENADGEPAVRRPHVLPDPYAGHELPQQARAQHASPTW